MHRRNTQRLETFFTSRKCWDAEAIPARHLGVTSEHKPNSYLPMESTQGAIPAQRNTISRIEEIIRLKYPDLQGGLNNGAESLSPERMVPKHSELFLAFWEHNLERSDTFIKEYFVTKSGDKG